MIKMLLGVFLIMNFIIVFVYFNYNMLKYYI